MSFGARILIVLLASLGVTSASAETARYRLTVDNTWSEASHPGAFPENAHFSWIGGGVHDATVSFWSEGALASPGMVQMAETGETGMLLDEVSAAPGSGGPLGWQHWFCPAATVHPSCGPLVIEFEMEDSHPLVTLVTMLGPSPDWFVGVSGLPLRDASGWLDTVVVDLRPFDGGTRSANVFALAGPLTTPPDPIALITSESGQLVGPESLGSFTFVRLPPPVPALGTGALVALSVLLACLGALCGLSRK